VQDGGGVLTRGRARICQARTAWRRRPSRVWTPLPRARSTRQVRTRWPRLPAACLRPETDLLVDTLKIARGLSIAPLNSW